MFRMPRITVTEAVEISAAEFTSVIRQQLESEPLRFDLMLVKAIFQNLSGMKPANRGNIFSAVEISTQSTPGVHPAK